MKLDTYTWKKLPPDLVEWLEDCTDIINLGKYAAPSITVPSSSTLGNAGEFGIAKDGATWYIYFYTGVADGWKKVALGSI